MKNLQDLFVHLLRDVYHAEKQATRAYPKLIKSVQTEQLRQAFEQHREETMGQIERLEQVFEMLDMRPRGRTSEAMQVMVAEGQEILEEAEEPQVMEAGIIAAAQAMEHYEISRYGTLIAWARQLGHDDAVRLLEQTLEEEKRTDQLLTQMAEAQVNQQAA